MKTGGRPQLQCAKNREDIRSRCGAAIISTASGDSAERGRAVPRIDGVSKVTGGARYAADFVIPNLAYAALVTSSVSKGRISQLKLGAARAVPGVLDILNYKDAKTIKALLSICGDDNTVRPLASSRIWHDGQIVAIVVAEITSGRMRGCLQSRRDLQDQKPQRDVRQCGYANRSRERGCERSRRSVRGTSSGGFQGVGCSGRRSICNGCASPQPDGALFHDLRLARP